MSVLGHIFIQCRSTSSRLPAKAFLDVNGLPSVVVCAKRLANLGHKVMVLTSDEASDDALAALLARHEVSLFRGALDDVLGRFADAAEFLPDSELIVRMTADNLLPDGAFVREAVAQFRKSDTDYASTMTPASDVLPYGMAVEVFTVALLREAAAKTNTAYEREHVTPYMRRHLSAKNALHFPADYQGLRCTMDTAQDYMRLLRVFAGHDPLKTPWQTLCDALRADEATASAMPKKTIHGRCIPQMSLGTVQLGMAYGITNKQGQPSAQAAQNILDAAYNGGVRMFDTAAAYGAAERLIGEFYRQGNPDELTLVSKLPPRAGINDYAPTTEAINHAVEAAVLRSCYALRMPKLDYYLLHRWQDYTLFDGAVWRALKEQKAIGLIARLGVSVYSVEEALQALEDPAIEFIQLPHNLLDRRWQQAGFAEAVAARQQKAPVVIQTRSAFLQGLLVNEATTPPEIRGFEHACLLQQMDVIVQDCKRSSRQDVCLAYLRAQQWVDSIVLGVETLAQLHENMVLFAAPPLTAEQCRLVEERFAEVPSDLLNPSTWQVTA